MTYINNISHDIVKFRKCQMPLADIKTCNALLLFNLPYAYGILEFLWQPGEYDLYFKT